MKATEIPGMPETSGHEPRGWRDDEGRSPVDVLNEYLRVRSEAERWAWTESRRIDARVRKGAASADDAWEQDQGIWARLREVSSPYLTDSARARSAPHYASPSKHDPAQNTLVAVVGPQRGIVQLTVRYTFPKGYGMPPEDYRYDLKKVEGRWLLHNRLGILPGMRPIGGLF
jgi:hypothetical protein